MKFTLTIEESKKQNLQSFKIDKSFSTKTRLSKRTAAVAEAFGIGIDETKTFHIFKDFQIEIKPGQVVLITGDSGSGKSTLLREIAEQINKPKGWKEFQGKVVTNDSVRIDPEEILIEGVGKDINSAISTLSMAGLNEAFIMLRRYKELSDGQKYRYRVAKMIDRASSGVWVFDEFAAVLDRTTAKVVSYTIQKTARHMSKTLILATTHEDLLLDVKPDIWIRKRFGETVEIHLYEPKSFQKECSLLKDVKIERCKKEDVSELEKFHYRGSNAGIIRYVFKATLGDELVAAIIYVFPHIALKGRNAALPQFRGSSTTKLVTRVNAEVIRISRVIVSPKYRSIGLGAFIVRETMPLVNMKYVETLAVMARYNFFFEKAGMTRVDLPEDTRFEAQLCELESLGFRREMLGSRRQNMKIMSRLGKNGLEVVSRFALNNCVGNKFKAVRLEAKVRALDKEALAEALQYTKGHPLYLYWHNPKIA